MENILRYLKNAKQGWKTTLLGSILILAGILSVFFTELSWESSILPIGLGIILIFGKDPKGPKPTAIVVILLSTGMLLLNSCITYDKCLEKYGTISKDSTTITYSKTIDTNVDIEIPGDSLNVSIEQGKVQDATYYNQDSSIAIKVESNKKKPGSINVTAITPTRQLKKPVSITFTDEIKCPPTTIFNPPANKDLKWYQKAFKWYLNLSGLIVGVLLLLFTLKLVLKK